MGLIMVKKNIVQCGVTVPDYREQIALDQQENHVLRAMLRKSIYFKLRCAEQVTFIGR